MKDELISFETAVIAKEKGFNIPVSRYYGTNIDTTSDVIKETVCYNNGDGVDTTAEVLLMDFNNEKVGLEHTTFGLNYEYDEVLGHDVQVLYSAPTQALLQKWIREEYSIHIQVQVLGQFVDKENKFYVQVIMFGENKWVSKFVSNKLKYSYEQALEAGILEALKLINTKTHE
jgi:hypothetical protein